jgi:hypothetical protein
MQIYVQYEYSRHPQQAEFLDDIGLNVLRVFLLAIHSHLY